MAGTILYSALILSFIGVISAQIAGGFHLVEADRYPDLIEEVNGIEHTGDFSGAQLINVKCAASQVVAGANYIVTGVFKVNSEEKTCTLKYSQDLQGHIEVTMVDCENPTTCSDHVIPKPT